MTAVAAGWQPDLALAHRLADLADEVTIRRFGAVDLRVRTKPDASPVTDADEAVEVGIRGRLAGERPGDVVLGEEMGDAPSGGGRRWIVDPVDGTKNFLRGVPVWATLLALEQDGRVVVGVASAPALGRRWWASEGGGAWAGRSLGTATRCRVSEVAELHDAHLSFSGLTGWPSPDGPAGLLRLAGRVWRNRGFGDFWAHLLVAQGSVDIACEPDLELWDTAAVMLVVAEAGGRCTDLAGRPWAGGGLVSSNGRLHDAALELLNGDGWPPPRGG